MPAPSMTSVSPGSARMPSPVSRRWRSPGTPGMADISTITASAAAITASLLRSTLSQYWCHVVAAGSGYRSGVQGVDFAGVLGQHVVPADLLSGSQLGASLERAGQNAEPPDALGPGHRRVRSVHRLLDGTP